MLASLGRVIVEPFVSVEAGITGIDWLLEL
jgi:hypothetical protein